MDSWRYEDDDEAGEYDEEDDELFREDLEALKRACMLTGAGDEYEAAVRDRVPESGNESEEFDDMEFLQSVQKKLCLPIDINTRTSDGSSDFDEDDFETLRAIERRFAKYDDDEAKKKGNSLLQHGSDGVTVQLQTNSDASHQSVTGSSNNVSTPLTLGSADIFNHEDCSVAARGHGPEGDELPSSAVVPLTKSHFSDSVRVFIEAVKKNRLCQQFIRSKLIKIEAMLSENKELRNRTKCLVNFQISCKRRATRFLRQESHARVRLISLPDARKQSRNPQEEKISPLFFHPRENSHVPFFRKVLSKFPSALKRRPWSRVEKVNLARGVKQQMQEFLLCNSMELLRGSEDLPQPNFLDSAVAEISNLNISPEHIRSFLPQVDWNRLASMYLKDRSGAECLARWLNYEDPLINDSPWCKSEDKQLLFIVQQGGPYNWIHIAEVLGNNRTASQCFSRYQRSLNVNILRGDWTEEEDIQLRAAVEACGENDWQQVASHLEGRTGVQCSNRWRKCLHPSKERFGRWTVEEDKRLKIAVTLFGPRAWKKISGFIPGRTQVQCRERWIHSLDPSLRLDVWTEEEDMKLRAAIAECGLKWSKVASHMPGRTNGQCRRRWKVLFPEEVSRAQTAQKIKKSALISNFVYRDKERPALGPDDFVPVQGDAETVDAKNAKVWRSKKSDDHQPVRCRRSRVKSVKAIIETADGYHKKIRGKASSTDRELVLHQGSSRRFPEAADGDETSVTRNLHKRVKKRKEISTGKQIIFKGDTDTFTCENGGNPKEDGRTQLNGGNAAPDSMDERVGDVGVSDFVENAEVTYSCNWENGEDALLATSSGCDVGISVEGIEGMRNADGIIDMQALRIDPHVSDCMNCLPPPSHGTNATCEEVFDDRIPDHGTAPDSSLIGTQVYRASDLNATGLNASASMVEDGCIQLEELARAASQRKRTRSKHRHRSLPCSPPQQAQVSPRVAAATGVNRGIKPNHLTKMYACPLDDNSFLRECSDFPQPVRCRRSRVKSVKTTIEQADGDETSSTSKSHKNVKRKANSIGRELVLHQEPNKRFSVAADVDETSVICNLHKRVEKRKEISTAKQIILQGDTDTFTCEHGGNLEEDGRIQLDRGNGAPDRMDDKVGVCDGHTEVSENQFLHKLQSLENGEAAFCNSRNIIPLIQKDLAEPFLDQIISPKDVCELPPAGDVGSSDFVGMLTLLRCRRSRVKKSVKTTIETAGGDQTSLIPKFHKKVERKVNSTGRELDLQHGPNKILVEAEAGDETSVTCVLHKRIKERKQVSTSKQIILQGDTDTSTCEHGDNPKEHGRIQLGGGNAAPDSMDDRVGVRDGHCEASENQFLHKSQGLENGEAAPCDSRNKAPLMPKNNTKEGKLDLAEPFAEQVLAPKDTCELPPHGDIGSSDFVENAEVTYCCNQETGEDALLTASGGCDVGVSVEGIKETHNAGGIIDIQAIRINPDASDCMNCLPPSHGLNAICEGVFDDRVPDHGTAPDSSLIGNVFGRSSADLNASGSNAPASMETGCIQLEDNNCAEKSENVGLLDSHNLEDKRIEAVPCEGIESNGVRKQQNDERALVKDSGCLDHGKESGGRLPRARRASRRNVNYRDMVNGNVNFDMVNEKQSTSTASIKNVNYRDMVTGNVNIDMVNEKQSTSTASRKNVNYRDVVNRKPSTSTASRKNVNYRDMVNEKPSTNTASSKNVNYRDMVNRKPSTSTASRKNINCEDTVDGKPSTSRASRKNVNYRDMVNGKFDFCGRP